MSHKSENTSLPLWVVLAILTILVTGVAIAQTVDAELTGLVKDPAGSAMPNATLTLTNQDTGVARTIKSDSEGRYRFYPVSPGRYTMKVEATGFVTATVTGLEVNMGVHVERDVPMSVGNVQESVTVMGEVPPIDTTD
jgi:hypothetical protein